MREDLVLLWLIDEQTEAQRCWVTCPQWVLGAEFEHSYSLLCCPQSMAFMCPFPALRSGPKWADIFPARHSIPLQSDPSLFLCIIRHTPSAWTLVVVKDLFPAGPQESPAFPFTPLPQISSFAKHSLISPHSFPLSFKALLKSSLLRTQEQWEEHRACQWGLPLALSQTLHGNWEMSFNLLGLSCLIWKSGMLDSIVNYYSFKQ